MKVVVDTNVIVSALLFGGKPLQVLEMIVGGKVQAYTAEVLIEELLRVLEEKFRFPKRRLAETEELMRENFTIVSPTAVLKSACDVDDDVVIAAALKAGADYLISGDSDLLVLRHARTIPIVNPEQFLRQIDNG